MIFLIMKDNSGVARVYIYMLTLVHRLTTLIFSILYISYCEGGGGCGLSLCIDFCKGQRSPLFLTAHIQQRKDLPLRRKEA